MQAAHCAQCQARAFSTLQRRPPLTSAAAASRPSVADLGTSRYFRSKRGRQSCDALTRKHAVIKQDVRCGAQAFLEDEPAEAVPDNVAVLDKLIDVFAGKSPKEWRKLIAHSSQWPQLAEKVFNRLLHNAQEEQDDDKKANLRKLLKQLQAVHDELRSYDNFIAELQAIEEYDLEAKVCDIRGDLHAAFFEHLTNLVYAAHQDPRHREDLAALQSRLLVLVQAYDMVAEDDQSVAEALDKFEKLLESDTLDELDQKMETLVENGDMDPALMLVIARAHNNIKETDYTSEEVKDVMAHMYYKSRDTLAKKQPPEVRILKHLLTLQDKEERLAGLRAAFTPGVNMRIGEEDFLSTTPDVMNTIIEAILGIYSANANVTASVEEAASLMNPVIIDRIKVLHTEIHKEFL